MPHVNLQVATRLVQCCHLERSNCVYHVQSLTRAKRDPGAGPGQANAVGKDLPRNEQGRSIDQSLLSVGEMVRRAPGWARRVLTMTGFLEGIGAQSLARCPSSNLQL